MGASPETVSAGSGKERYHHGGLREALIEAAETLLDERGVEGFSMREAARRAGVSSAAHAHHFKDARGLLTAVAAAAFTRFGEALESASDSPDLKHRLRQQALAYLRFALRERARFQLMWRVDLIDRASADYSGAVQKATRVLANARSDGSPHPGENEPTIDVERRIARLRDPAIASAVAVWTLVHGFSTLAIDGVFGDEAGPGQDPEALLLTLLDRLAV